MEKDNTQNIGLIIKDREECDYIIYSLKKLPMITRGVDMNKLNTLIGNLMVLKESLREK